MKKYCLLLPLLVSSCLSTANAADLLTICQQALTSDPTYLQAVSQAMSTKQNLPINFAAVMPNIALVANPSITRQANSGATVGGIAAFSPRNNTLRAYTLSLTATQTVFDAAQFEAVAASSAQAKGADATINAALQDLMVRTAQAYFQVLNDEDNLSYSEASKVAFYQQLDQTKQQFDVGLKTITDVYTAQASYDSALANYIAAETTLANDKENLRVITGAYYPTLSSLSESFPLVTPSPMNVDSWVRTAQMQNWSVKAQQYNVDNNKQLVRQQFAGHLPTVNIQGELNRLYSDNINSSFNISGQRNGQSTQTNRSITLNMSMPLFAGGGVVAQTNQAAYNYRVAQQQLEQALRTTISTTRQSYLGITAGISKISADKEAIKSTISALDGMEASYKVGTETLVNVLNQQQKVYQAQTQYAADRYAFVNNIFQLKQAAGTLSFDDLRAVNAWLIEESRVKITNKTNHTSTKSKSHEHSLRSSG